MLQWRTCNVAMGGISKFCGSQSHSIQGEQGLNRNVCQLYLHCTPVDQSSPTRNMQDTDSVSINILLEKIRHEACVSERPVKEHLAADTPTWRHLSGLGRLAEEQHGSLNEALAFACRPNNLNGSTWTRSPDMGIWPRDSTALC